MSTPYDDEPRARDRDRGAVRSDRSRDEVDESGDERARRPSGDEVAAPVIANVGLPKGGAAIRGLGESLQSEAFSGTASLTIPIVTPDARGFGPGLHLAYSSAGGNGPFGLGWRLSPPSVVRKTERGLPQYRDRDESDVFVLSGADDLVPALAQVDGDWMPIVGTGVHLDREYVVRRYRPRIEAAFARIERWDDPSDRTSFWRVTDARNVTSYFGRSPASRIADPEGPRRIFEWLLDRIEDDLGNACDYLYKVEDLEGVRTSAPWESARPTAAQPQRYLKHIRYGNRVPPSEPGAALAADGFAFEIVLDYGEHGARPLAGEARTPELTVAFDPVDPWLAREDPFSTFRPTFDLRTRRMCHRVLVFHRFADLGPEPVLTSSLDLLYRASPVATMLVAATRRGYVRNVEGTYVADALPPLDLEYASDELPTSASIVDAEGLDDLGQGVDDVRLQLVDLDGEGVPGLLLTDQRQWSYRAAVGDVTFAPAKQLPSVPTSAATARLVDLDGDGHLSLVAFAGPAPGAYKRGADGTWAPYRPLRRRPTISSDDSHASFVDVDGDGLTDLLVDRGDHFEWYRSLGHDGFDSPIRVRKPRAAEHGPQLVYGDPTVAIFHADMTGDGLADIVRVEHKSVVYWPNRGHGRFGPRIAMGDVPPLGSRATFSAARVRLADTDGTGASDVVVFDDAGAFVCRNAAGNRLLPPHRIVGFPPVANVGWADVADIDGRGMASLAWSSSLPRDRTRRLRVAHLYSEKPLLLTTVRNNLGAETRIRYVPSTRFYLADKHAGRPWLTRLPMPVHVVERVETFNHVTSHRYVATYVYHHGYFDGVEREFRGFGLVEQRDTETFRELGEPGLFPTGHRVEDETLHVPPVLTRTWFHTGAFLGRSTLASRFATEYWHGDPAGADDPAAVLLPDTILPAGLPPAEAREAVRALAGTVLRQEMFAEDGTERAANPYSVSERNVEVRLEQPRAGQRHAVVFVHDRERLSFDYEREPADPRVTHTLVLDVDAFGELRRKVDVAYPRRTLLEPAPAPEQSRLTIVVDEVDLAHQGFEPDRHLLAVPMEARRHEVTGLELAGARFDLDALRAALADVPEIPFHQAPSGEAPQRRLLARARTIYYDDDLAAPLPFGQVGRRALVFEERRAAFSTGHVQSIFGDVSQVLAVEGGYVEDEGSWWTRSSRATLDATRFYQAVGVVDPFGNASSVVYDADSLFVTRATDPVGNASEVEIDYRVLAAWRGTDPNGNVHELAFDAFGRVERAAAIGKPELAEGDTLADPTVRVFYDPWAFARGEGPNWSRTETREVHGDPDTAWLVSITYSDGGGGIVQTKLPAEPDPTTGETRWIGSGRVVRNNKGDPIRRYEPFFSPTPAYEDDAALVEQGVSPLYHYDPIGRPIRIDHPDGTLSRVEFTPWLRRTFDANDCVLESTWHAERLALGAPPRERRAAELTEPHASTPAVTHLDVLGRAFLGDAHNVLPDGAVEHGFTRVVLDVDGNVLQVFDARGNVAETRTYGLLGQVLRTNSVDAGERRGLFDVLGAPLRSFDARGFVASARYDAARRPTHHFVQRNGEPVVLVARFVYGEGVPEAIARNLRGRVFRAYDGAGVATHRRFDFRGNLREASRSLTTVFDATTDWSALTDLATTAEMETAATAALEPEDFVLTSTFDALGRPVAQTTPDGSEVLFAYNRATLLERVDVRIRGAANATAFVTNIDYNARGQRDRIGYGNLTTTRYTYDPRTFRLTRLQTTENATTRPLQDLTYTYDPVGNIADIFDDAQQDVFFAGQHVEPTQRFVYDALYRLVQASGREHRSLGQATDVDVEPRTLLEDGQALRTYEEHYAHDLVGNILELQHVAADGNWTRRYDYAQNGNRLRATSLPGDPAGVFGATYNHDEHGNMTAMPHLAEVQWDWADRMQMARRGESERTWFVYDAGGRRVRKVRVNASGTRVRERIYLGPYEIYRDRVNGALDVERQTLHLADDSGRICILETQTIADGDEVAGPTTLQRYQYGNHLGSTALELTETAAVISYEEYHPYGTSAYRAAANAVDVSPGRYRYIGRERDEETSLGHHGARYYAPWLGRWTAADPIGLGDGVNRFAYCAGNPIARVDTSGTRAGPPKWKEGQSAKDYERGEFKDYMDATEGELEKGKPPSKGKGKDDADSSSGKGKGGGDGSGKGGGGSGSGGGAGSGGGGGAKDPRGYEGPTSVTHGDGVTPNAKANAKPGAITGPSGVDIGSAGGTGTGGSGGPGGDVDGVAGGSIGEGGTPGANAGAGASTGSTEGGDGGGGSGTGGQASDSLDTAIATAGVLLGDHVDFERGKGGNHGVPGGSGDGSGSRLGQYLYLAKAALGRRQCGRLPARRPRPRLARRPPRLARPWTARAALA